MAGGPSVYERLLQQLSGAANEEEIRLAWVRALESSLPITFGAERDRQDLSYNNVVIEFKGPGKFKVGIDSSAFKQALHDRLLPYITRASERERVPKSDYIGLAIDDRYLSFVQVTNEIKHSGLLPITETTFEMVVQACRASYRRAVTAPNLISDFGHESSRGTDLMKALDGALSYGVRSDGVTKIKMLFEEWRTLYGQVADLSLEQLRSINGTLHFASVNSNSEVSERLFVVHTFNSLLTKLLAAEIVAAHGLASGSNFATDLIAIQDNSEFLLRLRNDIEHGGFFDAVGIHGFVEEVIFAWYLDATSQEDHRTSICDAIRQVLAGLALYRTDNLRFVKDVLRDFYQDLVPDLLRKALGEFYTPEWLVDFTLNRANVEDWIRPRILDPTCGSGSFLVETIHRKRKEAVRKGMSSVNIVNMVLESVWGFDLNPLAVQIARTNVLMSLADLLKETPGLEIEIPVLLADAVYSPARLPDAPMDVVEYQIGSQVSNLKIVLPAALAFDRATLDRVFEVMGELVHRNDCYEQCEKEILARGIVALEQMGRWSTFLRETYMQVLELHRRDWNGIWFRIVRNFFWSATAGRFDIIVGNPPWVRWSKLPPAYRERAKPTCEQYEIFSDTPHHGGNELDISGMITYTTADKWLRDGGTLAFVITQTHFQSPSSQGFRRFRINPSFYLAPASVDDMKAVRPFRGAANKTSVAVFHKTTTPPEYPISYRIWTSRKGSPKSIPFRLPLEDVTTNRIEDTEYEANPVGGAGSPWAILPPGRFATVSSISGRSTWVQGRKGITTDLNAIYFVSIEDFGNDAQLVRVRTRPGAGRARVGQSKTFWVEPDLLYPLLKGASDFSSCYIDTAEKLYAFVPNSGITRSALREAEDKINRQYPRIKAYFAAYEHWLRGRSTWRNRMPTAPFYAIYNVGAYTFAPYKVVWAEQSRRFKAAVVASASVPLVGSRPYVPDHKIFFVDFNDEVSAYYLCGLLNSLLVGEFVESHNISIQVGNIFKHMSLPRFSNENPEHLELADLTKFAHSISDRDQRAVEIGRVQDLADRIILGSA